jgi:hypothetical protein
MNVYETLRMSVLSEKPCRISMLDGPERKVCPYIIGKSNKGEDYVLYYQYGGHSSSGLRDNGSNANWRCNRIADVSSAEIVDELWRQPMQKPKTRGSCVVVVDVEVAGYY